MLANVTAALIAGGQSKRFGSPKQFAEYGDRHLIDYALDITQSISSNSIIISNDDELFKKTQLPVYNDLVKNCGPLGGIFTALHYAKREWIAVLPVDMPLLNLKIYRTLYSNCKEDKPVVACSHKGLEPLVSIWPVNVQPQLKSQIEKKDFRLYYLLNKLGAIEINFASLPDYEHHWFENINYKKDIKFLERSVRLVKKV